MLCQKNWIELLFWLMYYLMMYMCQFLFPKHLPLNQQLCSNKYLHYQCHLQMIDTLQQFQQALMRQFHLLWMFLKHDWQIQVPFH